MLENLEPPTKKNTLRIDAILSELDAKDKAILINALNSDKWSADALSNALKSRGIQISGSAIHRYRQRRNNA